MFLGQYRHSIDQKGRMTVPARFRELLDEGAIVTQGFEQNLMVLTEAGFSVMTSQVTKKSLTDPTARDLRRLLFSSADRVTTDSNGRILLPSFLREQNQLEGEAVLVGVGDFFEIWPPEVWEQRMDILRDTEANTQRFAGVDLSTTQEE